MQVTETDRRDLQNQNKPHDNICFFFAFVMFVMIICILDLYNYQDVMPWMQLADIAQGTQ